MKRISKPMINLFSAVIGGLALVVAMSRLPSENQTIADEKPVGHVTLNIQNAPSDHAPIIPGSFAPAVKKAAPSVVSVYSTRTVQGDPDNPLLKDPLFRHFFGGDSDNQKDDHSKSKRAQSLGAGVICTPDGYILTNFHVVEDAEEIKVGLADDHTEFTAKVVGTDPKTDVAVIKIDATNLPPITIGDSDHLQVGDVVLALGNPFGVGQTVT
ncbi:MAG TPA: trypsin-like peptidase domain-containing protein, partial [Verrucomicrobiae bacterium]|nr:trypsin-like peptidase domain-containing protein [Verrucomicrobiae bacterium]